MSEGLEFFTYDVFEVGKMIKASKVKHVWMFSVDGVRQELRALESMVSNKFRVMLGDKIIYDHKVNEDTKRSGINLKASNFILTVRKLTDKRYDLFVREERFVPNTIRKKSKAIPGSLRSKEGSSPYAFDKKKEMEEDRKRNEEIAAKRPAFNEWMNKDEKFLDFNNKDDDSDDEIFKTDNEKSQFRIDASDFNFGDSRATGNTSKGVEAPSRGRGQQTEISGVGLKLKKKDQPEMSKNFDEFMNFDFGREKTSDNRSAVQPTRSLPKKSEDLFDFGNSISPQKQKQSSDDGFYFGDKQSKNSDAGFEQLDDPDPFVNNNRFDDDDDLDPFSNVTSKKVQKPAVQSSKTQKKNDPGTFELNEDFENFLGVKQVVETEDNPLF